MSPVPEPNNLTIRSGRRRLWILPAAVACLILALLRLHWTPCLVAGHSMEPTLAPGDLVLLDHHAYTHTHPRRGDIVVAQIGSERLIKRIVGLPGETVEIRDGQLFVNGRPVSEPHPLQPGPLHLGKGNLRPDHYALLGDNRTVSDMLPVHLVVHRNQILGKVTAILRTGTLLAPFRTRTHASLPHAPAV